MEKFAELWQKLWSFLYKFFYELTDGKFGYEDGVYVPSTEAE